MKKDEQKITTTPNFRNRSHVGSDDEKELTLETRIFVANAVPLPGDLNQWAGKEAKTIPPLILTMPLNSSTRKGNGL